MKTNKHTDKNNLHEDFWYASIGFTSLRFVIWGAFAAIKTFASQLASTLSSLNLSQLGVYGIYSALFTITDAIKLKDLWTGQGQYANKELSLFKKLKTTIYTVTSRAFELGFYAVTLLMTLGVLTMTTPVAIGFMAAYSLNGLVRYGHSLARAVLREDALNPRSPDYDEQKKAATYKLMNSSVKLGLALLIGVILTVSIVMSGPFAPIVTAALWVTWGVSNLVYNAIIKPRLKEKYYPKPVEPTTYIELKPVKSSRFKADELSFKHLSVHDGIPDRLSRERRPLLRSINHIRVE